MIKKREQKRAVSTLIATVLMIGVVMAAAFLVNQGYQKYMKSKAKEIQKELVKTYCPQEFDFDLSACYIADTGTGRGILNLRIDSKYGEISDKSRILVSGGGVSIGLPTLELGIINPALPIDRDVDYPLSVFKDGIIEKVKLMPLFKAEEEKIEVVCDNLPEFDVLPCSKENYCKDGARVGECSLDNPGLYCNQEAQLEYNCTAQTSEFPSGCWCPSPQSNCCDQATYDQGLCPFGTKVGWCFIVKEDEEPHQYPMPPCEVNCIL